MRAVPRSPVPGRSVPDRAGRAALPHLCRARRGGPGRARSPGRAAPLSDGSRPRPAGTGGASAATQAPAGAEPSQTEPSQIKLSRGCLDGPCDGRGVAMEPPRDQGRAGVGAAAAPRAGGGAGTAVALGALGCSARTCPGSAGPRGGAEGAALGLGEAAPAVGSGSAEPGPGGGARGGCRAPPAADARQRIPAFPRRFAGRINFLLSPCRRSKALPFYECATFD